MKEEQLTLTIPGLQRNTGLDAIFVLPDDYMARRLENGMWIVYSKPSEPQPERDRGED